jgi:hypothetical protein
MESVLSIIVPFGGESDINVALAATVLINLHQMRMRRIPRLYESGIRYRQERCLVLGVPETCERFLTAEQALRERWADCDDLSSYRTAELIHTGEDKRAQARVYRSPGGYHAIVVRGDGRIEDPSARLGMPVPGRG